jgi:hypothetical protein
MEATSMMATSAISGASGVSSAPSTGGGSSGMTVGDIIINMMSAYQDNDFNIVTDHKVTD